MLDASDDRAAQTVVPPRNPVTAQWTWRTFRESRIAKCAVGVLPPWGLTVGGPGDHPDRARLQPRSTCGSTRARPPSTRVPPRASRRPTSSATAAAAGLRPGRWRRPGSRLAASRRSGCRTDVASQCQAPSRQWSIPSDSAAGRPERLAGRGPARRTRNSLPRLSFRSCARATRAIANLPDRAFFAPTGGVRRIRPIGSTPTSALGRVPARALVRRLGSEAIAGYAVA